MKVRPIGTITLLVYAVDRVQMVTFFIIDTPSLMNVIMGHKWIHAIRGVVSTLHQVLVSQWTTQLMPHLKQEFDIVEWFSP